MDEAFAVALAPHGGPTFVDFPLDYVFMSAPETGEARRAAARRPPRRGRRGDRKGGALLRDAERPVVMAGTDLYWGHGEQSPAGVG